MAEFEMFLRDCVRDNELLELPVEQLVEVEVEVEVEGASNED